MNRDMTMLLKEPAYIQMEYKSFQQRQWKKVSRNATLAWGKGFMIPIACRIELQNTAEHNLE